VNDGDIDEMILNVNKRGTPDWRNIGWGIEGELLRK